MPLLENITPTHYPGVFYRNNPLKGKEYVVRFQVDHKSHVRLLGHEMHGATLTPKAAAMERLRIIDEIKRAPLDSPKSFKLKDLFAEYLDDYAHSLSSKTTASKRSFFRAHIPHELASADVRRISNVAFQRLFNAMIDNGNEKTAQKGQSIMVTFYTYLSDRGLVTHNPARLVKLPKVNNVHDFSISDDQAAMLVRAIFSHTDHLVKAALMFLLNGRRIGETLALRWDDIDFDNSIYTTAGDTVKNGNTYRYPLPSFLADALSQMPQDSVVKIYDPDTGEHESVTGFIFNGNEIKLQSDED